MAKSSKKRTRKATSQTSSKQRRALIILAVLLIPAAIGLVIMTIPKSTKKKDVGPSFFKEGELQLLRQNTDEVIKAIDIEIADNDREQERGLMWRRSMEENQGMLFLMEAEEMQRFWMLNTYISLDIIFLNSNFEIVTIQKNTKPQSLDGVPSTKPAKYVLEVIAGFSDKYNLKEGDRISYKRTDR
ncbi:MAG: DUF192 domain-containing protein [Bacteroidota bacterium]